MLRITLSLAALCALLGPSGLVAAEKPGPAEMLRQLRKPVREWLERDVAEKTRAENRAYAGLVLAFGLAWAEYTAACGRLAPAEATERLEELFTKLAKVPDTYTTATHYSRYHLMILEAPVLGLTAGDS